MSVFHTLYFMHASFNYGFLPLSSSILLLFPLPTLPPSAYLPYAPYHSLLQPGSAGGTLCVITARAESLVLALSPCAAPQSLPVFAPEKLPLHSFLPQM